MGSWWRLSIAGAICKIGRSVTPSEPQTKPGELLVPYLSDRKDDG